MTAVFDIYEAVLQGTYLGQTVNNRFHYQITNLGSSANTKAQVLAEEFEAVLMPKLLDVTHELCVYDRVVVQNLNDLTDVFNNPITSGAGVAVGGASPSFNTWSFQLRPFFKTIKWGRKSFAGVPENLTDGNDPGGTAPGLLSVLATQLQSDFIAATLEEFAPVVARIPVGAVLPYVPFAVGIAEAIYRRIGTQDSRKVGSGS